MNATDITSKMVCFKFHRWNTVSQIEYCINFKMAYYLKNSSIVRVLRIVKTMAYYIK